MNEDLRNWFRDKWVRMNTKGDIVGDCARDEGEDKPKCLPIAKARAMDKKDRASAVIRKRREDPVADRAGKGNKPINVATEEVSTSELIKKSHSKRGASGTLKAKIKGPLTLEKIRSLKNRANATTLDKKQANFYINMHSEEYLEEKNTPTNPGLWARAKSLARSKFDIYPSAYANGWAAKWYKGKGGGWKSVQEGTKMKTLKEILAEGVAVSSDFKLVNSVDSQGRPTTRKVRAHRKTINPISKDPSEEKPDVLASIQKFVGRQYDEEVKLEEGYNDLGREYGGAGKGRSADAMETAKLTRQAKDAAKKAGKTFDTSAEYRMWHMKQQSKKSVKEEVEQVDEVSTDGYHKAAVKSRMDAAVKVMSSMGSDKQAVTRLNARNKGLKRLSDRTSAEMAKANSGPQKQRVEKEPTEAERRGYGQGRYMGDSVELEGEIIEASQSPSMRMFKALQKIKQQRETEEARKKENEKRALTPKQTNEAKDPREYDYEGDMAKTQLRSIIANSQSVHDMLKDTTNLAEWVQSKITKAEDYISTVADYMTAEVNESKDEEDYSKHHKLDPDSGVEADQHIHVQLKKAIDSTMKPYEVSFKNGKKHTVSSPVAKTIVTAIEKLKPEHRKFAHDELHKSYDSLMAVHKAITGK